LAHSESSGIGQTDDRAFRCGAAKSARPRRLGGMRGRVFASLVGAASAMAVLVASHYMSVAPGLVARLIGTVALLVFVLAVMWLIVPPYARRVRRMEYLIVAGITAAFGVAGWWALGRISEEKPVAASPPDLRVIEQDDGGDYFLVVENNGAQADVWADLKIEGRNNFNGGSDQRIYQGYWENTRKAITVLKPGQRDRLLLGGVTNVGPWFSRPGEPPAPSNQELRFSFFDSGNTGPGSVGQTWVRSKTPQPPKPLVVLGVSIHADPAPTTELRGSYFLTVDGVMGNPSIGNVPR
jgi:hypothetical protein